MSSFIIESFKGGRSDFEDKGVAGAFKNGRNLNIRKRVDSLTCNQALLDITPPEEGFTDIIDYWVPSSDGNIYGFARDGRIYQFDSDMNVTLKHTDTDGAILGAWEWGLSNGNTYLFWATANKLHQKLLSGASDWSDIDASITIDANTYTYPKSDLSDAETHMMLGIGGGIGGLVICNDDALAMVGYDGSYSNDILTLTPGQSAAVILQRGIEAVIGSNSKNQLFKPALFSWDGDDSEQSFGFDDNKPLPLRKISAIVDTELQLLVDDQGQVFFSDFVSGLPIFIFPDGSRVNPSGITTDGYMALFGVYGGESGSTGIWSYGRKVKNGTICPNLEYAFDCDEIGGIIKVGDHLLASYSYTDEEDVVHYGVKDIDPDNKAIAVYESLDLKQPAKTGFGKTVTWAPIVLTTKPLPAGTSIGIKYRLDKDGDFKDANLDGGDILFTTEGGKEATFLVEDVGKVEEIQMTLTPNGNETPEVYRAESFFS